MKRTIIKALSVFLAVILTFTAAPLSGFIGLDLPEWFDFSIMSKAASNSYLNSIYTQTHVVENYSSKYDNYEEMYFDGFATAMDGTDDTIDYCIPGLDSGEEMIPQGITYYSAKDWILISAYNKAKEKNSMIYALDRKTGFLVAEFEILKKNAEFTGHLGGIAASENNLYMSYGGSVAYIPLSSFDVEVGTAICLNIADTKSLSSQLGDANVSYVTITDGVLYAGNFYNESPDYNTRASDGYASVVIGYSLAGNDSKNEWENLNFTSPSYKYNISDSSGIIGIQSATVKNGYLYLSCSYGRNNDSELKMIAVGNNAEMECNTVLYACNSLPMMEGIAFIGDSLYIVFESAADYYFNSLLDKSENPTDVLWKLDYKKIFSYVLDICGENLTWTFDGSTGVLTISGTGPMYDYQTIGFTPWYMYRSSITKVVIENGVTSIGEGAFVDCISVTSISIPDSVTTIGMGAFMYCKSLESITIPDSVTTIGMGPFMYCESLSNVIIGNGVTTIGSSMFMECTNLTSVSIGNGVTTIGDMAFNGCTNLASVIIGNSVASIGMLTFYECTSLTSITIPDSVTSIDIGAFASCTSLVSVNMGNSVTSIGESAFASCTSLASVSMGNSVTTIGDMAFAECTSLACITIPDSVTSIGMGALIFCTSLASVSMGNSVTSIGDGAFAGCTSLTSINIPDSVTSIGMVAFGECISLTSITIPDSVTSIGDGAFMGCTSMTNITVDGNNQYYSNDTNGVLYNKDKTTLLQYPGGKTNNSYAVPNGVKTIGMGAFAYTENLTNITLPDGVTTISNGAFGYCSKLTNITIPVSVTTIEASAFEGCTVFTDVYYGGTAEQWKAISIDNTDNCNDPILNATIHFTGSGEHTHNYAVVNETAPTCITDGYVTKACSCGAIDTMVVPALGHSVGDAVVENEVPATCIAEGSYDTVIYCKECSTELSRNTTTYPASGHTLGDAVVENEVPATCLAEGSYDTLIYCKECSIEISRNTVIVPLTGHNYETTVTPPTCTEVGYTTFTCECGDSHIANKTRATGHKCIDGVCLICGETNISDLALFYLSASDDCLNVGDKITVEVGLSKNVGIGTITMDVVYNPDVLKATSVTENPYEGTCNIKYKDNKVRYTQAFREAMTDTGTVFTIEFEVLKAGNCEIDIDFIEVTDDYFEFVSTDYNKLNLYADSCTVNGHNYESVVTSPTCIESGYTTYTCNNCDDNYVGDEVPALGHDFVNDKCTRCGKSNLMPKIEVSQKSLAIVGKQVQVAISLENNPGITSMLLKVSYDTSKLELAAVNDSGNLGQSYHSPSLKNPYTLSWANDTATENITYNGEVVVLTFNVAEDAELGETPITVTYDYDNYDILDVNMQPVEFDVVNGTVEIIDVIIGDVNNDSKINQLDRVMLTRYIANWEGYTEENVNIVAADVNCDGKVNQLDRVILTRYIANWDGYSTLPYKAS